MIMNSGFEASVGVNLYLWNSVVWYESAELHETFLQGFGRAAAEILHHSAFLGWATKHFEGDHILNMIVSKQRCSEII